MKRVNWSWIPRRRVVTGVVAALALGSWAVIGNAQSTDTSSQPPRAQGAGPQAQDQTLTKQLEELRAQVARLQAELERQQQSTSPGPGAPGAATSGGQMGQMGMRMGEMGRRMGMGEMGSMPPGGEMSMMDMHKGEMGMPPEGMRVPPSLGMGEMGGMASPGAPAPATPSGGMQMGGATAGSGMQMGSGSSATRTGPPAARPGRSTSALPGVPGASHLYHIGSTGFFLDQPQITLTSEQQATLNRIKERALLERSTAERRTEQAEQELWALTGADQPDAAKVEAKLKEVEQLRTTQRMAFIRAVGEASNVLTAEQRNVVLGMSMPKK
jgi:Spy/CpxP family protein refolding chaperone